MHTEYKPVARPPPGRVAVTRVLPVPEFARALAVYVGEVQLVPSENLTAPTLLVASRPSPVIVINVVVVATSTV